MDQFCSRDVQFNNKTVPSRCLCSGKFQQLSDRSDTLDKAKTMLQQFNDKYTATVGDTGMTAVEMSAQQVGSMATATAGETALSMTDTSAAADLMNQISDLLSGKNPTPTNQTSAVNDFLSGASFTDFTSASIGGFGDNTDVTDLKGTALFNSVDRQCSDLVSDTCGGDQQTATLQMVRSAYGIMISSDCNNIESSSNSLKEQQINTAGRSLNQQLRAARLREFQAHNSSSMNQCIADIRQAITCGTSMEICNDGPCGKDFQRCLDFTGLYINQTTGEPIFSPRLFQLANQIVLENPNDPANKIFLTGLDSFKNRAKDAMSKCRDTGADDAWTAFKQQALIEIAQAQDRKLEDTKNSCVGTMADCYDNITGQLNSFDDTKSQMSGAMAARAASGMCADKVAACANLFSDPTNTNCVPADSKNIANTKGANVCGLQALLAFVSTVDNVRVAEGCETTLQNWVNDTCAPSTADTAHDAPWGCRLTSPEAFAAQLKSQASLYCMGSSGAALDDQAQQAVDKVFNATQDALSGQLVAVCNQYNGLWVTDASMLDGNSADLEPAFVNAVYAGIGGVQKTVDAKITLKMGTQSGAIVAASALPMPMIAARTAIPRAAALNTPLSQINQNINIANIKPVSAAAQLVPTKVADLTNLKSLLSKNTSGPSVGWGLCLSNSVAVQCRLLIDADQNQGNVSYNTTTGECVFSPAWFQQRCEGYLGGYMDNGVCYVAQ